MANRFQQRRHNVAYGAGRNENRVPIVGGSERVSNSLQAQAAGDAGRVSGGSAGPAVKRARDPGFRDSAVFASPRVDEDVDLRAQSESIFSVDVEDWFHIIDIPGAPQLPQWDSLPSCVERNFMRLLDLFSEKHATVTCFFLGWIAERFPNLVREASQRGHEIASHGYAHQLTYQLSNTQFYDDVLRARKLLEDASGTAVVGYRAPSFSVSDWFFETLIDAGYTYDASVFPAPREHGGMRTNAREPYVIKQGNGHIFEFPISVVDLMGKPMCFSGGGYLRLLPYSAIRHLSHRVLDQGRPVVFYIHPREIDPYQPRLSMGMRRRFKTYVNLATTESKLARLLDEFPVTTFRDYLSRNTSIKGSTTHER